MESRFYMSLMLVFLYIANTQSFRLETCGDNDILQDLSISILPDPIKLKQKLTVGLFSKLARDMPADAQIKYRIYKKVGVWVKIPFCIQDKYGSCEMPFCKFLEFFAPQLQYFFPPGRPTKCPVTKGTYQGKDVSVQLPDVDSSVLKWFASGDYSATLELFDKPGGKQLACFDLYASLDL